MNLIQKLVDTYDPARESFICALKATIPALIATAIYLYFRRPFSSVFFYTSAYCLVLTFFYPTYKGKITVLAVTIFLAMLGMFTVSILTKHIYTMLFVLFPILMIIFGSMKYKYAASVAPVFIAIALALPTGWREGVNRCIELGISFAICLFCLALYELIFVKYRARSNLVYISELIYDLFFVYTSEDKVFASKKIRYKHLFKKHSLYRTDIIPNKIFKNDSDRFMYKVNLVLTKTLPVVFDEDYIFARSKFYIYGLRDIFTLYRRMYRNISLMTNFEFNLQKLCEHVPLTDKLIENIRARLKNQNRSIYLRQTPNQSVRDPELIEDWMSNLNSFLSKLPPEIDKSEMEYLLGLRYIVHDIDALRAKLRKIRYGV
ncbi:MAG: hypothetical protein WCR55_12010 [Lentisphaerota bacterium]